MSVRLLLSDVDGTLVTPDKELTARAIDAVRALRDADVLFAITSGRPPRGMAMLVEPLALTTPIAAFNGGLVVEPDLRVVEQRLVPEAQVGRVIELLRSFGLAVWVYRGADWLVDDPDGPHVAREASTVQFQPRVVEGFEHVTTDIAKIVGVSDDHDAVTAAEAAAHDAFSRLRLRGALPVLLRRRDAPASEQGRRSPVPVGAVRDTGGGDRDDRRHAERRAHVRALGPLDRNGQRAP